MTDAERWALVASVIPWCERLLSRSRITGTDRDDARSDLYLYIFEQAHRYDPSRGAPTTWAFWMARGAMRDFRVHRELFGPRNPISAPSKRVPIGSSRPEPTSGEDATAQAIDTREVTPRMMSALAQLDEREQTAIVGMANGCTLTDLGKVMGVSRERVRQIREGGLKRIRSSIFVQGDMR